MGRTVSAFAVFGTFCIAQSMLVSYAPDVSILKAVSFLIMALTLSISWFSRRVDVEQLQGWMFFWLAAIVFTNAFSASSVPDNFEYKLRLASITVSAVSRSSQQVQSRIHHSKFGLV